MDTKKIKQYFTALLVILALDLTWLNLIMDNFYNTQLISFNRPETVPIVAALLVWVLMPLGIVFFVQQVSGNWKQVLVHGALYGLILYGVYNLTNYAILEGWPLTMLIVDIIWGTCLCTLTSLAVFLVSNQKPHRKGYVVHNSHK